jgi:hypothetical protein
MLENNMHVYSVVIRKGRPLKETNISAIDRCEKNAVLNLDRSFPNHNILSLTHTSYHTTMPILVTLHLENTCSDLEYF